MAQFEMEFSRPQDTNERVKWPLDLTILAELLRGNFSNFFQTGLSAEELVQTLIAHPATKPEIRRYIVMGIDSLHNFLLTIITHKIYDERFKNRIEWKPDESEDPDDFKDPDDFICAIIKLINKSNEINNNNYDFFIQHYWLSIQDACDTYILHNWSDKLLERLYPHIMTTQTPLTTFLRDFLKQEAERSLETGISPVSSYLAWSILENRGGKLSEEERVIFIGLMGKKEE